jgi:hypothetical protein
VSLTTFPDAYYILNQLFGKADGLIGLGYNLAMSISFEKFLDKTHACGVGVVDGLAIKVMASWTSK